MPAATRWELQLFGSWELRAAAGAVEVATRQQRLIAALAVLGPRLRRYVANLLWPDTSEERAAGSLRTCLFEISHGLPALVRSTRDVIALEPGVAVDLEAVRRLIGAIDATGDPGDVADAIGVLARAELLPGWYEDWVVFEQERLSQKRLSALEALAARHLERGEPDRAIRAASAAVAIEPVCESAHLLLVRGHLLAGDHASALRVYQRLSTRLQRELGIGPSAVFDGVLGRPGPAWSPLRQRTK